jgi:NAD(P)-dependent dehydrogenase (short-subunit alcohol dehydrogenase family)
MASRLPGRRTGTPADVARAIGDLIEDDFVTGTVLHAEGGQLLV